MPSLRQGCGRSEIRCPALFERLPEGDAGRLEHGGGKSGSLYGKSGFEDQRAHCDCGGQLLPRVVPSYLISFLVAILSAYFFTVQREEVLQWLKKVFPCGGDKSG